MSQEDAQVALERVEDLWFPDANLILRSENKLFRVYSHILGAHSPVFRDMVAFPQPANPEGDTIDGSHVVRLHDSGAELEVFLRAIFDSSFFMPPPAPIDFSTVIGVLRLAHKYDVQYLFRRALSHLGCLYPQDFSEFQQIAFRLDWGPPSHHIELPNRIGAYLITLRAASEVGALWLLPGTYYSLCTFPSNHFFAAGAAWSALGVHEQQTCLKSQVELMRGTGFTHLFLDRLPETACTSKEDCDEGIYQARSSLSHAAICENDLNPLGHWTFDTMNAALCSVCADSGMEEYTDAQLKFWNRLPEIFGLPGWNELKEMRRAIMEEA
ncbi:hypothetical protein B0H19DRAFT_155833 [Mycena capillaripes]|nr:hypothetical protein B0H19DRAFT_155833 [Mycena capillaripes]